MRRFQKLIDAGKLKIKIVYGRMVVELPSDILFASAQASLPGFNELNQIQQQPHAELPNSRDAP